MLSEPLTISLSCPHSCSPSNVSKPSQFELENVKLHEQIVELSSLTETVTDHASWRINGMMV